MVLQKIFIPYFILLSLSNTIVSEEIKIHGPGLQPKNIVMPARYFFVNFTSINEKS